MLLETLQPQKDATDAKTAFWNTYKMVADEHDKEVHEIYSSDLDTSIIFAGLFSAVTSAFIIQGQPELQQDPREIDQALLRILIHAVNGSVFSQSDILLPEWTGPSAITVVVQSLLYISLFSMFSAGSG
ncbi:hypothetical protein B0H19DRAFT_1131954 [Mycena capillaripes]|nr:hypothetical protein B0H19DRAFT_1131954 [Mycena capillaripes]